LATPANAQSPEPAAVRLPVCAQDTPIVETPVPGCSYLSLATTDGKVVYAHLTAPGAVKWLGTSTDGSLTFPSDSQTWPTLSLYSGLASARISPTPITGRLDPNGEVSLQMIFDVRISALGAQCAARGSITVSTSGTDSVGGAQGMPRVPSGEFAVAGASTTPPTLAGSACDQAQSTINLNRGAGFYGNGIMTLGGSSSGAAAGAQTAAVPSAGKIKRKGRTVLLPKAVRTNAGQRATTTVRWSPKKSANGSSERFAAVRITKSGRVTLTTTGKANRLHVRMTLSAPATKGYREYLQTVRWVVH
jgi:hypothetical protein